MFTEIELHNFKAFDDLKVELKPLTLFLGPNNSGKSSILAAPRLLTQTIESFDANVVLLLNGILGDFGTYRDIVFGNNKARHLEIGLSIRPSGSDPGEPTMAASSRPSHTLLLDYQYRAALKEIVLKRLRLKREGKLLVETKYCEETRKQTILKIGGRTLPQALRNILSKHVRLQHFVSFYPFMMFGRQIKAALKVKFGQNPDVLFQNANRGGRLFFNALREVEYIGAMRVPPERSFLFSGERRVRIGARGEHSISILVMDSFTRGARSKNILPRVIAWLAKADMASDVKVVPLSDRYYELHVQHPDTHEFTNFADVGYGNSQVLPVLIGGYNLTPGSTYLVEEPEIHLHPGAQAELGDFFLELYRNRVQSLVETHSEHLVLRLQQHVAAGLLPADKIAFYYVYSKQDRKIAFELSLDEKGRFKQEWPKGFFPERLNEAKHLARLRSNVPL